MGIHYFDPSGVESLRDNGYRDTGMALAELIDNSIQAEATKIEIILIERQIQGNERIDSLVNEIVIIDNGEGMNRKTLENSLRFGGGTRHGAKKGLGKFGMGLPNSSASQCPRFEVFSWQKPGKVLFNYFDFEEIKKQKSEFLPEVIEKEIPEFIQKNIVPFFKSGTLIRWVNCDRLSLRRSKKLIKKVEWPLGRIFRYFINEQSIEIKIRVFENNGKHYSENLSLSKTIKPVDPLFLMTNTQLLSPYDSIATSEIWEDGEYLFPDPKGDAENKKLFKEIGESITIKFSIVKREFRDEGGGGKIGDMYEEFQGISILRSKRELKIDEFGFINDVSDPRNRWWKVEINFDPTFDSLFGVDNTKQNVHAFKNIKDKDENAEEESLQFDFISKLSKFLETNITQMKKAVDKMGEGKRTKISEERTESKGSFGTILPTPLDERIEEEPEEVLDSDREELRSWLLLRYPEYALDKQKLKLAIHWFFNNNSNQVVVFLPLGAAEYYNYKVMGHKTIIEINTEHGFYLEFISPLLDENDHDKIDPMLLLFGAMVEAEKDLISYKQYITQFRSLFAVKLGQFILYWKESK
jgi:hypothetical protein